MGSLVGMRRCQRRRCYPSTSQSWSLTRPVTSHAYRGGPTCPRSTSTRNPGAGTKSARTDSRAGWKPAPQPEQPQGYGQPQGYEQPQTYSQPQAQSYPQLQAFTQPYGQQQPQFLGQA